MSFGFSGFSCRSSERLGHGAGRWTICFAASLSLLLGGCFSRDRAVLDKPAVNINGHDVSTQEFADRLAVRLKPYDSLSAKDEATLDRAKEETVQILVLELITRDYARAHNLTVSNEELDKAMSDIKSKYPDDFAFRRALSNENLSIEAWRKDMEFTSLQKKVYTAVTAVAKKDPTDAELKSYYDANKATYDRPARIRLRQIVVEKEDIAHRIYDQLSHGANLETLARQYTAAPEAAAGGDTGWLDKGTLDIFDQAFKMPIGARSKVLKSPYGWHIYEVLKKEPEAHLSFSEVKDKIRAQLQETASQTVFRNWLEEQVRKSTVKRNEAVIRAIQVTTRGS